MSPIRFNCSSCQAPLRIGADSAGKRLNCPKCGQVVQVPAGEPAGNSLPLGEVHALGGTFEEPQAAIVLPDLTPPMPAVFAPAPPGSREMRPCPYCQEVILAGAVKCKHCGEFLDRPRPLPTGNRASRPKRPMGAKQVLIVLGAIVLIAAPTLALLAHFEVFPFEPDEDDQVVEVPELGPPPGGGFVIDPEMLEEARRRQEEMIAPPTEEDLAKQPEEIRRAMRANVQLAVESGFRQSQGSGVILQIEGNSALILTNRHVVRAEDETDFSLPPSTTGSRPDGIVAVRYITGDKVEGQVVWMADDDVDLALVKALCPSQGVQEALWRTTPSVRSGEKVFAIGNPSGLGWTYTSGEISALRTQGNVPVIQTDTAINPGNSGGGLYTAKGELIGINTLIINPNLAQNLGFAIRASFLKELAPPSLRFEEAQPETSTEAPPDASGAP